MYIKPQILCPTHGQRGYSIVCVHLKPEMEWLNMGQDRWICRECAAKLGGVPAGNYRIVWELCASGKKV